MKEFNLSHISQYIRQYRQTHSLSLEKLSARANVCASMICNIEAGKTVPTISVLWKLAQAMHIPVSQLVDPSCTEHYYKVRRPEELATVLSPDKSYTATRLTTGSKNRKVDIYAFQFSKKGSFPLDAHPQGTTEYLTVEEGKIGIEIADEKVVLSEGESIELVASKERTILQESKHLGRGMLVRHFC